MLPISVSPVYTQWPAYNFFFLKKETIRKTWPTMFFKSGDVHTFMWPLSKLESGSSESSLWLASPGLCPWPAKLRFRRNPLGHFTEYHHSCYLITLGSLQQKSCPGGLARIPSCPDVSSEWFSTHRHPPWPLLKSPLVPAEFLVELNLSLLLHTPL